MRDERRTSKELLADGNKGSIAMTCVLMLFSQLNMQTNERKKKNKKKTTVEESYFEPSLLNVHSVFLLSKSIDIQLKSTTRKILRNFVVTTSLIILNQCERKNTIFDNKQNVNHFSQNVCVE